MSYCRACDNTGYVIGSGRACSCGTIEASKSAALIRDLRSQLQEQAARIKVLVEERETMVRTLNEMHHEAISVLRKSPIDSVAFVNAEGRLKGIDAIKKLAALPPPDSASALIGDAK